MKDVFDNADKGLQYFKVINQFSQAEINYVIYEKFTKTGADLVDIRYHKHTRTLI